MSHLIKKVVVIGAGTMGAAIAAHLANAGLPVMLLDVAPATLTPQEEQKGLTLTSPAVRNRLVQAGFERMRQARPAALMSQTAERLIILGNTEDNFDQVAEADWIIEAIIEKREPKQAMMARIEAARKSGSLVSSNTSGLPIAALVAGRSDDFKRHFLGTHFFNPPRTMKLLEIIPTPATDLAVIALLAEFGETRLGKGIVLCKDTPNFIGNRLFSPGNSFAIHYGLAHGYSIEEVDNLTGPLLGRPKTATFRLQDLVGLDIAAHVAQNLYELIPHDPQREVLRSPHLEKVAGELIARGWLGNKSKQGFYKQGQDSQGQRLFLILNPATFEYEAPQNPQFESSEAVGKIPDLGRRLTALFDPRWQADRAAQLAWAVVSFDLAYAAACAQEIAHDLKSIDEAVRWGFAYEAGPFELWDKLGVAHTAATMEASGLTVAPWVQEMLAAGCPAFYRRENGFITGFYEWETRRYRDLPTAPRQISLNRLRQAKPSLPHNDSASLHNLGEGALLLEFHTRMNAIDEAMIQMMGQARALLDEAIYTGLVIGNEGENFCAGGNLSLLAGAAQQGQWAQIEALVRGLQQALLAFRYSPKPVVAAAHGRALGGGAEILMSASRVVAHAESYIGLVELNVGLVPAGGGVKELLRRLVSPAMQLNHTDPLPLLQTVFETIALTKISGSAAEARDLGFLGPTDRIVMNRDHLLYEAKQEVLKLAAQNYAPPVPAPLFAGGRDLYAALKLGVWMMQQGGYISEHEAFMGDKLAYLIAGGNLSTAQWVDETYFLDLERQTFLELISTEKTQTRMWHTLQTGQPLRN